MKTADQHSCSNPQALSGNCTTRAPSKVRSLGGLACGCTCKCMCKHEGRKQALRAWAAGRRVVAPVNALLGSISLDSLGREPAPHSAGSWPSRLLPVNSSLVRFVSLLHSGGKVPEHIMPQQRLVPRFLIGKPWRVLGAPDPNNYNKWRQSS